MKINFYVQNQTLSLDENYKVVEGSKNYLKARFYFTGEWYNLTKTAVFSTPDKQLVYHVLLEDNECFVPPEVITKAGFTVSVFAGDLINTEPVTVTVGENGFIPNVSPPAPTPSVYNQMIQKFDEKLNQANNVLSQIQSSNATAEAGLKSHRTAATLDHPDGSVTDAKIGNRTIADPNSTGTTTGTLTTLLSTVAQAHRTEVSQRKTADAAKLDKTQYASVSQAGAIKLYSANGTNRSGLVVYDDGSTVVNTRADRGVTRDGAGQISINPATTDEIDAGTDAYKPIVPATLRHAVQSVTGQLSNLNTADKSGLVAAINEVRNESVNANFIRDVYGEHRVKVTDTFDGNQLSPFSSVSVSDWDWNKYKINLFLYPNKIDLSGIILNGLFVGNAQDMKDMIAFYDCPWEYDNFIIYAYVDLDLFASGELNCITKYDYKTASTVPTENHCVEAVEVTDENGKQFLKITVGFVAPLYDGTDDSMGDPTGECEFVLFNGEVTVEAPNDMTRLWTKDKTSVIDAINELVYQDEWLKGDIQTTSENLSTVRRELSSDLNQQTKRIDTLESTLGALSAQLDEVNGV